jgi:hypothetical protein
MFSAHGERLTGGASRDYRNIGGECLEVEAARVDFMHRPALNCVSVMSLVLTKSFASVVVPFDHGSVLKAGVRHADCKSTCTREKLYAIHRGTPLSFSLIQKASQAHIPKS